METWVGIGEACRILGVRPATLRRWTRDARIHAFVTPGGHRRYKVSDLVRLVGEGETPNVKNSAQLANVVHARQAEAVQVARQQSWYGAFKVSDREEHRVRGRLLLSLLETCLTDEARRPGLMPEVSALADEYGRQAAGVGLSLRELLAAFQLFRRPLFAALDEVERGPGLGNKKLFQTLTDIFDVFTGSMVEAYLEEVLRPVTGGRRDAAAP